MQANNPDQPSALDDKKKQWPEAACRGRIAPGNTSQVLFNLLIFY